MTHAFDRRQQRREFLRQTTAALGTVAGLPWIAAHAASPGVAEFRAGQGVVDTTPPLGIELAGFHRPPENPRRITSVRQPSAVRAIMLELADARAAIISLDILAVSTDLTARVAAAVERETGIPAANVRLSATHTHSMPTFRALRQWGAISPEYMRSVETAAVKAVQLAKDDLAPAEMLLGKSRAEGANFNRTRRPWKTDVEFGAASTESDRWLDTMLHVLLFRRGTGRPDLLWYHFACHPVSYQDEASGPDWPGLVDRLTLESHKLVPSYLQGHAGDVNPGDGTLWIGKAEPTAAAVHKALVSAIDGAQTVHVDQLRVVTGQAELPFDLKRLADEVERYRSDPAACDKGEWVDAKFAADWFAGAQKWNPSISSYRTPLSALQLGPVGLLFHSSELYSYYGLALRRGSPFRDTLAVGYTDDFVGYLTDPAAYAASEYAAVVVPKLVDLPPFTTDAASAFNRQAAAMLDRLGGRA
ncbi:MAG TPA: neutral/alkaline non-lysosomal ceramidase N-terminal domain-containing protein [Pirellulales bacterium]|jgi:hypothetical protein|nr:neutral/alkaline non-lysosomal ceramidase N-terminal domain-containing protein [Pirellulales bacterium]